jgi:hypothetical protein
LFKDEAKNHFKTAIKAKKCSQKMIDFVGKKERNERVSTLLWAKGLRWLHWLEEPCLKWLQGCQ